ncbi:MAG: hypothetical protein JXQ90_05320 [Cyclobacteriaceae bacterium]
MTKKILKPLFALVLICLMQFGFSQDRPSIAVISIDTKGLEIDNETMASVVRLELEKINRYEVLDKYDVSDILSQNNINPADCFGKNAVVRAGNHLKADFMLTGSAEVFGGKIILILRMVDIKAKKITTTSVMEYLEVHKEIQTMAMISLNELLGIPNDPHLVDLLINYNLPITTAKTTVKLNGPRMGSTFTLGATGERMRASRTEGGYNMFPVSSMFGYQFEQQYLSSGEFQALVEIIPAVNGLESGTFIPSISVMNGFRFSNSGLELGLGPIFRVVKRAKGFIVDDKWMLEDEIEEITPEMKSEFQLDHRGTMKASVGLIIAIGKTFRSGYLNVPVNIYCSPRKDGTVFGLTFGFNTSKRPKI